MEEMEKIRDEFDKRILGLKKSFEVEISHVKTRCAENTKAQGCPGTCANNGDVSSPNIVLINLEESSHEQRDNTGDATTQAVYSLLRDAWPNLDVELPQYALKPGDMKIYLLEQRFCRFCDNEIEDEIYRYLITYCPMYDDIRHEVYHRASIIDANCYQYPRK